MVTFAEQAEWHETLATIHAAPADHRKQAELRESAKDDVAYAEILAEDRHPNMKQRIATWKRAAPLMARATRNKRLAMAHGDPDYKAVVTHTIVAAQLRALHNKTDPTESEKAALRNLLQSDIPGIVAATKAHGSICLLDDAEVNPPRVELNTSSPPPPNGKTKKAEVHIPA